MPNRYPLHLEREYIKLFEGHVEKLARQTLPKVLKGYERELKRRQIAGDALSDDLESLFKRLSISDVIKGPVVKVGSVTVSKSLFLQIESLMNQVDAWSFNTMTTAAKAIERSRGISGLAVNIFKSSPALEGKLNTAIINNAGLIKTVSRDYIEGIANRVGAAVKGGRSIEKLAKELEAFTGVTASRARFWARDQISKTISGLNRERIQAAGFPGYIWETMLDNKVRDDHANRHGIYFEYGKTDIDPGDDFNDRCTDEPALDEDDAPSPAERKKQLKEINDARREFKQKDVVTRKPILKIKPAKHQAVPPGDVQRMNISDMRSVARESGVSYAGMMNGGELATLLQNPSRTKIMSIQALSRWRKKAALTSPVPVSELVAKIPKENQEIIERIAMRTRAEGLLKSNRKWEAEVKDFLTDYDIAVLREMDRLEVKIINYDNLAQVPTSIKGRVKRAAGLYNYGNKTLAIMTNKNLRNIFNHEMGHFVDDAWGVVKGKGDLARLPFIEAASKGFQSAQTRAANLLRKMGIKDPTLRIIWKEDYRLARELGDLMPSVSAYSLKNKMEYFADAINFYMQTGDVLLLRDARLYNQIKDNVFKGREFR